MGMLLTYHDGYHGEAETQPEPEKPKRTRKKAAESDED